MSELKKLLEGVKVEWKSLGEVAELKRGRVMSKKYLSENSGIYPVYSSQTANNGEIGKINSFDFSGKYLTWTTDGANAGTIFYREGSFSITNVCGLIAIKNLNIISYKFLFYWLNIRAKNYVYSGMGNPKLMTHQIEKIPIPIPCPDNPEKSLKIQQEIVRILDRLSEETNQLNAALQKELVLHQKQYDYYREELFKFEGKEVEWKSLREVGDIKMCKRIFKNETKDQGDIPFYKIGTFGKKPNAYISKEIYELYKSKYSFPNKGDILISAAGTIGRTVVYNGEPAYFQDSNIIWLENHENLVTNKYLWHFYKVAKWYVAGGGTIDRLYNDNVRKTKIPIPYPGNKQKSLEEQNRIVKILDDLDTETKAVTKAIQKEVALRNKQYEYYRDRLLSFQSLQTEAEAIQ